MVKVNLEVVGDEQSIIEFLALCGKLHALARWGASRTIPVDMDGDGSGKLWFSAPYKNEDSGEDSDHIQDWFKDVGQLFKEEIDGEMKTHYIGE